MKVVLIVDDEFDITHTFALLFELHGFEALCAANGQEALELLRTRVPDVIVSDCMMSVMDGLEFFNRVKADPALRNIPFILMSAAPMQHKLAKVNFDTLLRKPFQFNSLLAVVAKLLDAR